MMSMVTALPSLVMVAAESADWHGLSSADFQGVFDDIYKALPIILPACIGLLAFRKGWSFIRGMLKGA